MDISNMNNIESRVQSYWTKRAHNFNIVRKNELNSKHFRTLERRNRSFSAGGQSARRSWMSAPEPDILPSCFLRADIR